MYKRQHLIRKLFMEQLERRLLLTARHQGVYRNWFGMVELRPEVEEDAAEVLVQLTEPALALAKNVDAAADLFLELPITAVRGLGMPGQLLVESNVSDDKLLAVLESSPLVTDVRLNAVVTGSATPNDPEFFPNENQYALRNSANSDADIDATQAWDLTTGSKDVVVAVIDSGIAIDHPDLAENVWRAPIDKPILDPDGETQIVNGWDFVNRDSDPTDDLGHGTHVAGIIGAKGNNTIGIAGVNWDVSLLPIKILDHQKAGSVATAVEAINYVTLLKTSEESPINIQVINASWGGPGLNDPALESAIEAAGDAGILFVTAAGNGSFSLGQNIDEVPYYPAGFNLDNMLTVGASNQDDEATRFSNFGKTVHLSAPGQSIISTYLSSEDLSPAYATSSGTSMAAPLVSGVAALAWDLAPNASVREVRQAILMGGDLRDGLAGKSYTGRRLNARQTLEKLGPQAHVTHAPNVTMVGGATYRFTATLTSPTGDPLDSRTIGDGDFVVRRVGADETLSARLISEAPSENLPEYRDLIYEVSAPGGSWDPPDGDDYEIVFRYGEVSKLTGGIAFESFENVVAGFEADFSSLGVFQPTVFYDGTDAPGDGGPQDDSETMTLRAAVLAANAFDGQATVILEEGFYQLSLLGTNEDGGLTGDLDITGNVSIVARLAGTVTIDAGQIDRVFDVHDGASLSLDGITVSGGSNAEEPGGGIRNFGDLTVSRSSITSNTTGERGGGLANVGHVVISGSTIHGNVADSGAGLWNEGTGSLLSSTISGNSADSVGGGILNSSDQLLSISNVTIVHNQSANNNASFPPTAKGNMLNSGHGVAPSVDLAESGEFIVADSDGERTILTTRFDANNQLVGQLDRPVTEDSGFRNPDVRLNDLGEATLAYSFTPFRQFYEVWAQRLDASGNAIVEAFPVALDLPIGLLDNEFLGEASHMVTNADDSVTVVTYTDNGFTTLLRAYDHSLRPLHQEALEVDGVEDFRESGVAIGSGTMAAVVWSERNLIGFRTVDFASGEMGPILVATASIEGEVLEHHSPAIAASAYGFAAVWVSRIDEGESGVYLARFDSNGAPIGVPEIVNTVRKGSEGNPAVDMTQDGRVVVTWRDDDLNTVHAQLYDPAGQPVGGNVFVTMGDDDDTFAVGAPVVAINSFEFVVVWPSTMSRLFAQRFSHAPTHKGGGIFNEGSPIEVGNSIIALNNASSMSADVLGQFSTVGGNLVGIADTPDAGFDHEKDQIGSRFQPIDPLLGPLQTNGGATLTHRPLLGSPAVDQGEFMNAPQFDQRGVRRLADGNENGIAEIDIGAVELVFGSIEGKKFNDSNGNGLQETGEEGLSDWTIYLDENNNGRLDIGESHTTTNELGDYEFTAAEPGQVTIAEVSQSGWTRTYDPVRYVDEFDINGLPPADLVVQSRNRDFLYFVHDSEPHATINVLRPSANNELQSVQIFTLESLMRSLLRLSNDESKLYAIDDLGRILASSIAEGGGLTDFEQIPGTPVLETSQPITDFLVSSEGQNIYVTSPGADGLKSLFREGEEWIELPVNPGGEKLILSDDERHLFVAAENHVVTYSREVKGGILEATSETPPFASPIEDIKISEDSRFLYALTSSSISAFEIQDNGRLNLIETLRQGETDAEGNLIQGLDGRKSLAVSPTGDRAYVTGDDPSDQSDGTFTAFRLDALTSSFVLESAIKRFDQVPQSTGGAKFLTSLNNPFSVVVRPQQQEVHVFSGGGTVIRFARDGRGHDFRDVRVGKRIENVNFSSYSEPGRISGTVFTDLNNNGELDGTDEPFPKVTVYLDTDGRDGLTDGDMYVQTTDAFGNFVFHDLKTPVTYRVRLHLPMSQSVSFPNASQAHSHTVVLQPQQFVQDKDFRVSNELAGANNGDGVIRGVLYEDTNANGNFDRPEESPLSDRLVYLDLDNNATYEQGVDIGQTTQSDGSYLFSNLGAADYVVRVLAEEGELTTSPRGNLLADFELATGAAPGRIAVADLDIRNGLDLIVADSGQHSITVWLRREDDEFERTTYSVSGSATDLVTGHFNSDEHLDIAFTQFGETSKSPASIGFLLGRGDGSFFDFDADSNHSLEATGWGSLVAADFDGDSLEDLAVAVDGTGNFARVLLNQNGTTARFESPAMVPDIDLGQSIPLSIATGLLNDDDLPDLVIGDFSQSGTVRVLLNSGGGTFSTIPPVSISGKVTSLTIADATDDGFPDVVGTSVLPDSVFLLEGNGMGEFAKLEPIPVDHGPSSVTVTDVDGDADADLIVGRLGADDILIVRKEGREFLNTENAGTASFSDIYAPGLKQVLSGDLDTDGDMDVIALRGSQVDGQVVVSVNAPAPGSYILHLDGTESRTERDFGIVAHAQFIPGDANEDRVVDFADFLILSSNFGQFGSRMEGDFDASGFVDFADFLILSANFGRRL